MPLSEDAVTQFAKSFSGSVFRPSDAGFDAARDAAIWNGDIDRQPALIVQPADATAVADAVRFARENEAAVTVRGGGHGFSGKLVADGAIMIDLSQMNSVRVDPQSRRAYVGGGAHWALVDAATAEHGLAVVGGTVSHTGVAGLTLSGGMGWLTPFQGLACDNLVGATLVTADGRVVNASANENPELFWGLRGAGANFGVVTELVFGLHEVNPMANLGMFFWHAPNGTAPLRFARNYVRELPDGMSALVVGMTAPPAPFVPEEWQGKTGFAVVVVSWGDPADHAAAIQPLRDLNPQFELVTPIPYAALQQMLDDTAPWGVRGYDKGIYLDELTDEVVDILVDVFPRKQSPLSFVPMFPLGGAFSEVADDATAFGGPRRNQWSLAIAALAFDGEAFEADKAWARTFWTALRAHAPSEATYVNFSSDRDDARIRASYGEEKYRRLAALKAAWDPDNVFSNNANIPPIAADVPGPRSAEQPSRNPA